MPWPGTRKLERLDENLGAAAVELTPDALRDIDSAASKLQRSPTALAESLLQLELGGWVKALPGSRYVRVK